MKRSEMVTIISDLLEDWYAEHQPTKIADTFLTAMESRGMLPPKACIERSVRVGDEQRTAYHNTNEWEPENE